MASCFQRCLGWTLHLALVSAIEWRGPSSTSRSWQSHTTRMYLATEAPSPYSSAQNVDTPASYEAPHICGYVDYNFYNSYTCAGSHTCLWNSHLNIVGCGKPTSINYITSCVPFHAIQDCDSNCFANPSIIQCGSELPHCMTPRVGVSYSIIACHSMQDREPFAIHMVYHDQSTVGHIPRWLGDDGNITYATRSPHLAFAVSETSSMPVNSSGIIYTTPGSISGVATNGLQVTASSPADTTDSAEYVRQQQHKEVVAGGVIGSLMVLVVVVFIIGVLVAWRRKVKKEAMRKGIDRVELRGLESRQEVNEEERTTP